MFPWCFTLLREILSFFQSTPLYFVTHGSLMFIFMQPFLAHEFNHLLLSACTHMNLVVFEPQQIFQVLAALSVCICKVTGCRYILRLYVFSLAFSAPQGMFQSQRNFRSFVKTSETLLKANSQFMSAHLCCLDNNNCHYLKENKYYIYYPDKTRGVVFANLDTVIKKGNMVHCVLG